jgi:regulator of ribonuclease activity A
MLMNEYRLTPIEPKARKFLVEEMEKFLFGGGSRRRALVGGNLGVSAVKNGWAGIIIHGCIRDSAELAQLNLGIRALGTMPLRSDKRGEGERDVPVRFAGVTFRPGDHVYVDEDGVIVAHRPLG